MGDLIKLVLDGTIPLGVGLIVGLVFLATQLPKLLNNRLGDKIDGGVLARIERHEKRMDKMDRTIHRQQVHITRFEVVVLHLVGLLVANGVKIPEHLQEEIDELTMRDGEDDAE